ncbi:hypothetical protein [Bradyrhizobium brasilense]|uniref:hypothetical protein n=1 Tax=Bradyrhizobium brasilense TaxID=1419277 RepID=UPI0035C6F904
MYACAPAGAPSRPDSAGTRALARKAFALAVNSFVTTTNGTEITVAAFNELGLDMLVIEAVADTEIGPGTVLLHKLREAMADELKGRVIGREGKTAEVDGGYFGGYVKPANQKE